VADAFFVALRLPNHFRAIFAEGAFNAAFVPAYARVRGTGGHAPAQVLADRIFTLLLACQLVLLAIALAFTPWVIDLLAPGFAKDPARFSLAVDLTRITFPYLLLVSLVTLYGGILNALDRFAAAAAAPILLNLSLIMALALAAFFPTAGHAAAWGVLIAGVLEVLLVAGDAKWQGVLPKLRWPSFDVEVKTFLKRFGPATVGSRCSPTLSSRAFLRPARCRRSTMPIGSTSSRSASSGLRPAPCCCRRWRAASPLATKPARGTRRTARSS
jgi:putative peptidoglycan lipid II flippase